MLPLTDPTLVFTILVLLILVAPLLAARLRVPDLVLLLVVGTVIGPNGAGILERDSAITLFGNVGLIYIMFLAGLEIDLHRFLGTRQRAVSFGVLTFLIPQSLGALAGRYLLGLDWQASVLLASMFASHTLLAYPIASRLGIARSEPVAVTVSATIITDTLALLVLAVIADSARGVALGLGFWLGIGAGMGALLALTWWGIPWLTRWFFHNVTEAGGAQFLFVLGTVCGCSYLSHFAKMEPIVGAFLAGAAFNRLIPEHSTLMNRVVFVGSNLFIPFFLLSVGMLVDPAAMAGSPRTWLVAATMVVTVIATKLAAAWLAGACFGYDRDARQVMFGLSVVQAAATLAAVLVGFELGIFDETILNGTIAMIAVTCPLGAWMVDRHGRRMAQRTVHPVAAPSASQRLLVSVANPGTARRLLELAFVLRDSALPGTIEALTVIRDEGDTEEAVVRGEQLIGHCLTQAAAADIAVQPAVRVDTNPADGIVHAAKELHATLALCGWTGGGLLGRRVFGTVMEKVLDACAPRLLCCRLVRPLGTNQRLLILWPPLAEWRTDLLPLTRDVRQLATQLGAQLRAYVVGDEPKELRQALAAGPSPRPLTVVSAPSLRVAQAKLFADVGPDDLILLLCERRSGSLWTPSLDSLPARVSSRFPNNSMLVAYPPLAEAWEVLPGDHGDPGLRELSFCPVELSPGDTEQGLLQMGRAAFPGDPRQAADASRLLLEAARSFPIGLAEGVVLLHGHSDLLDRPVLVVARSLDGHEFPGLPEPAHLVLGLLSPTGLPPERHLGWLKHLAGAFRDSAAGAIRNAGTSADICRLLQAVGGPESLV